MIIMTIYDIKEAKMVRNVMLFMTIFFVYIGRTLIVLGGNQERFISGILILGDGIFFFILFVLTNKSLREAQSNLDLEIIEIYCPRCQKKVRRYSYCEYCGEKITV